MSDTSQQSQVLRSEWKARKNAGVMQKGPNGMKFDHYFSPKSHYFSLSFQEGKSRKKGTFLLEFMRFCVHACVARSDYKIFLGSQCVLQKYVVLLKSTQSREKFIALC